MALTTTKLRQNIYKILDNIIKTGTSIEIERKGQKLKIIPEKRKKKFDSLKKHSILNCKPESIVHIDWSNNIKMDI